VPPEVSQEIAELRDHATVVGAQAAQLGNRLSHLGAQIERIDDELGRPMPSREREELERRRAELDLDLTVLARHVDALLGERGEDLDKLATLEQSYGLPASRFHIVSDGMDDDRRQAEREGRRHRAATHRREDRGT
jgi:chromosome segregation ATPase